MALGKGSWTVSPQPVPDATGPEGRAKAIRRFIGLAQGRPSMAYPNAIRDATQVSWTRARTSTERFGMDYVHIGKLEESDFDAIIEHAGGRRLSADDSREYRPNADYALGEAVVELKLVEEEGLEKVQRQRKVAEIFRPQHPDRPVIILRPELLDDAGRRAYYSAMAGPIKGHVKTAAKQLEETAKLLGGQAVRVLILMNNGYAALSHEEFTDIAFSRACNDTRNIDCVVVGGLYYYSDRFDMYLFERLEMHTINVASPFRSFETLRRKWLGFVEQFMTSFVRGQDERSRRRLPVVDFKYDLDGITYIKPAPPMGKPSEFWPNGRPRENSTGSETCPPVAKTFPNLDVENWRRFRKRLSGSEFFKGSFAEWLSFKKEQEDELGTDTMPFVPVAVDFDACLAWCEEQKRSLDVPAMCQYANALFDQMVRNLMERARDRAKAQIVVMEYVLLVTEEIGQDKANDLSSIFHVHEGADRSRSKVLLRNGRIFFDHALALACAYAAKQGVGTVLYEKDRTQAWI